MKLKEFINGPEVMNWKEQGCLFSVVMKGKAVGYLVCPRRYLREMEFDDESMENYCELGGIHWIESLEEATDFLELEVIGTDSFDSPLCYMDFVNHNRGPHPDEVEITVR